FRRRDPAASDAAFERQINWPSPQIFCAGRRCAGSARAGARLHREEAAMGAKTISKSSITAEAAEAAIRAAEAKAAEIGVPMVIAVVDESGVLKAFTRMDGAALLSVQIAQDKAYTAVSFGISTDTWFNFIKDDPPLLHGIVKTDRLVVFGGGYPLMVD